MPAKASKNSATTVNSPLKTCRSSRKRAASFIDETAAPPTKKVVMRDEGGETEDKEEKGGSAGVKGKKAKGNKMEKILKDSGAKPAPPPRPVKKTITALLLVSTAKPLTCQHVAEIPDESDGIPAIPEEDSGSEDAEENVVKDKGKGRYVGSGSEDKGESEVKDKEKDGEEDGEEDELEDEDDSEVEDKGEDGDEGEDKVEGEVEGEGDGNDEDVVIDEVDQVKIGTEATIITKVSVSTAAMANTIEETALRVKWKSLLDELQGASKTTGNV
ncbi:hypothetical protein CPB84DRAFT_1753082 [Gymnopilus junonius]|uniref:Uncharacterized protein n=1 Tax=Gymnopilus junonius TaxID=109634 RepID=A0A9P5N9F5_GYMJU|nr:hypothetical protein CPB84DRAFT_1753082 [Gymnopilus junonius]